MITTVLTIVGMIAVLALVIFGGAYLGKSESDRGNTGVALAIWSVTLILSLAIAIFLGLNVEL